MTTQHTVTLIDAATGAEFNVLSGPAPEYPSAADAYASLRKRDTSLFFFDGYAIDLSNVAYVGVLRRVEFTDEAA